MTIRYFTRSGTAASGSDFTDLSGLLNFPIGVTNQSVRIPVIGDIRDEPNEIFFVMLTNLTNAILTTQTVSVMTLADADDETNETFSVVLSAPVHASLGRNQAVGTIIDGNPPCIFVNDILVRDNGTGNIPADFTVSLSSTSSFPISLRYTTTNGTAIAGPDFVPSSGVLTIPPGMTNGTIHVSVLGNTQDETNEYFSVVLFAPTNATICKPNGICTILNGTNLNIPPLVAVTSPAPNLCLTTPTNLLLAASASDSDGLVLRVDFYADATNFLGRSFSVPYQITWINVPAGVHKLTAVALDNAEKFATSAPVHLEVRLPAVVSITNASVVEGDAGANLMLFPLRLASPSCQTVTVDVATSGGSALVGVDYLPVSSTTITFPPGVTEQFVSVPVLGDALIEPDETFSVLLTNAFNATIGNGIGLGTIINDDSNYPPTVIITNPANNAVFFTPPGLIPICADARDSNGFVRQVDFYAGTNLIGRSTNTPFCITWTNNVLGAYTLTAIATDNDGARATSAPVNMTIQACQSSLSATMPASTVVCPCSEVVIQPVVTGTGPFQYVWKRDGTVISAETNAALNLGQPYTVRPGVFTVEITGPCNSVTNSTAMSFLNATSRRWTNSNAVAIPDFGTASPYPSTILVGTQCNPIAELRVTLLGLHHDYPDDLDILLVGPDGTAVALMSDAGGSYVTDADVTFDDHAINVVPDFTQILSGSYKPADYPGEGMDFYDLVPGPNATELSAFSGSNPEGVWSLYIVDDHGRRDGSLTGGWVLDFGNETPIAPSLTEPEKMASGVFQMKLNGQPYTTYFIEASSDLRHWDIIQTNVLGSTSATIIDTQAPEFNRRFYRASGCRN